MISKKILFILLIIFFSFTSNAKELIQSSQLVGLWHHKPEIRSMFGPSKGKIIPNIMDYLEVKHVAENRYTVLTYRTQKGKTNKSSETQYTLDGNILSIKGTGKIVFSNLKNTLTEGDKEYSK
jgi:hypothetical protein